MFMKLVNYYCLRKHEAAVFTKFHRIMTKNVDFFIIGRFLITVANFG